MTGPTTGPAQPEHEQPQQPDQLDVLALTLGTLHHQAQALGGAIVAALQLTNMLLAERGRAPVQPQGQRRYMTRTDAGFSGAGPQQGTQAPQPQAGRPLPAHPDRTFGAQRRQQHEHEASPAAAEPTTESPT